MHSYTKTERCICKIECKKIGETICAIWLSGWLYYATSSTIMLRHQHKKIFLYRVQYICLSRGAQTSHHITWQLEARNIHIAKFCVLQQNMTHALQTSFFVKRRQPLHGQEVHLFVLVQHRIRNYCEGWSIGDLQLKRNKWNRNRIEGRKREKLERERERNRKKEKESGFTASRSSGPSCWMTMAKLRETRWSMP
jgi:hypothetical protein